MKQGITSIFVAAIGSVMMMSVVHADIAIIVNNSVSTPSITADAATSIFLGKMDTLADGTKLVPIDQEDSQKIHGEFYAKVVKKDAAQLNAYWSRLIFTGKGEPPKKVADDAEVIALVKANPNIIGYVDASAVNSSVKVLLRIP